MTVAEPPLDRRFLGVQLLTLSRIPLAALFAALLLGVPWGWGLFAVCLGLLVLIELTDFLDGTLARRLGIVSEWGAMLDPYADSTSRLIVYWAFAAGGFVLPLTPLVMALRDVGVAYCRIVMTRHRRSVSANVSGKIKAVVQCGAAWAAICGPFYWEATGRWPVAALSWLVILVTAGSAVQYALGALAAARGAQEA